MSSRGSGHSAHTFNLRVASEKVDRAEDTLGNVRGIPLRILGDMLPQSDQMA
jgi:hypothetical protein